MYNILEHPKRDWNAAKLTVVPPLKEDFVCCKIAGTCIGVYKRFNTLIHLTLV